MAEVVACSQERTIPEYELMRRHQVFTDEQIRSILKTRENYQYKLSKNAKKIKDYGEYIIYEKKLHNSVTTAENARKEKFPALKASMANRIVRLYKEALRGFPEESRLWDTYIKFCKSYFISEVPNAYEKYIQKQGENPSVWCGAALWFHEQGNNMEKVKNIFFRGLQRHPESEMLYSAFFNILLLETANQPKELRKASLERVTAIYNTAKKKICHVNFLTHLVDQCDDDKFIEFSKPLQKLIFKDMMELYPREEAVWDLLAQREFRNCSMSDLLDERPCEPEEKKDTLAENKDKSGAKKGTLKRRIEMCYNIYQTAVDTLKTPTMYSMFINAMMELNTDLSTQQVLKRKKLAIAFRGAHENNCMSEDHYYAYINLLMESNSNKDYVMAVMTEATDRYVSVKLWEQFMTFYIVEDNQPKVYEIFRRAVRQLGPASSPIYKLTLQYYQTRYDDQLARLVEIFREACKHVEPQFLPFRSQYLEWMIVNNTLHATRKAYTSMTALTPPCLELHQKMILLESQTLKPDGEKMREYYENAIRDFGATRSDVWIDFLKFERGKEPKSLVILYERAIATLHPKYVDNFITEHCLLNIGEANDEKKTKNDIIAEEEK